MQRAYGYAVNLPTYTVAANATVTVYNNGTLVLATIFADNLSTPKANPFTADGTTGYWFFYAANGRYDVKIAPTAAGVNPYTNGDVDLNDVFSLNGLTASTQTLVIGSAGTAFNIVDTAPGIHTLNLPDASATADGTINTGPQTIAGPKTFTTPIAVGSGGTGLATLPANGQLLIGNGTIYVLAPITGTANQVIVTNGAGSITLSTPQSIGTGSSPTFASIIDSALAAVQNGIVYVSDTLGTLAVKAALTNGQLLIGSTGAAPVGATLTSGASGNLTIVNTAGAVTIDVPNVGITSLNGLLSSANPSQLFVPGSSGSDFNIASAGTTHTFNIPDAGAATRGLTNFSAQTYGGQKTFNVPPQYQAGGSIVTPSILSGVIGTSITSAAITGTTSTAETTLATFSLPANALNAAGKVVRITAYFTFTGAATQNKTARVYFGATAVAQNIATSANHNQLIATCYIFYNTSTSQIAFSHFLGALTNFAAITATGVSTAGGVTPGETATAAITLKATGQVAGASSDTVTFNAWVIEVVGA